MPPRQPAGGTSRHAHSPDITDGSTHRLPAYPRLGRDLAAWCADHTHSLQPTHTKAACTARPTPGYRLPLRRLVGSTRYLTPYATRMHLHPTAPRRSRMHASPPARRRVVVVARALAEHPRPRGWQLAAASTSPRLHLRPRGWQLAAAPSGWRRVRRVRRPSTSARTAARPAPLARRAAGHSVRALSTST